MSYPVETKVSSGYEPTVTCGEQMVKHGLNRVTIGWEKVTQFRAWSVGSLYIHNLFTTYFLFLSRAWEHGKTLKNQSALEPMPQIRTKQGHCNAIVLFQNGDGESGGEIRDFHQICRFYRHISDVGNFQLSPRIRTEKSELWTENSPRDCA